MNDYLQFYNMSHDIFCIVNNKGFYKKVNPAFVNLLGYSEKELKAHIFTFFVHPDDVSRVKREYADVVKGKHNTVIENRFRSKDGKYHWISWSTIVQNKDGVFYTSGQNVTEPKRLKTALKKEHSENHKKITKAIIQTQEKERTLISQELHDNVNQVLTTVKLLMDICLNEQGNVKATLQRATKLQQKGIDEIRRLSKSLSAPSLGNIKLCDSIAELVHDIADTSNVIALLDASGIEDLQVDQYIHLAVYRILQEHLTNILKHANASRLHVIMSCTEGELIIEVKDDGKGFDTTIRSKGIGIQNMKTRVDSVDGSLLLVSAPAIGCTLTVHIPLTTIEAI